MIRYTDYTGQQVQVEIDWTDPDTERKMLATCRADKQPRLRADLRKMHARNARLLAAATPAQARIGWGDYWRCDQHPGGLTIQAGAASSAAWGGDGGHAGRWPDVAASEVQLVAPGVYWGQVMPLLELMDAEQEASARHGDPDPYGEAQRAADYIKLGYALGWRHGRGYSTTEPGGWVAPYHVATLTPLTARQYSCARLLGWPDNPAIIEAIDRHGDNPEFLALLEQCAAELAEGEGLALVPADSPAPPPGAMGMLVVDR